MIIDGHIHLFQNEDFASKIMSVFNQKYSISFQNTGKGTADDLSEKMDKFGITKSIISNFGTPKHLDSINRWSLTLAALRSEYDSLISIHP